MARPTKNTKTFSFALSLPLKQAAWVLDTCRKHGGATCVCVPGDNGDVLVSRERLQAALEYLARASIVPPLQPRQLIRHPNLRRDVQQEKMSDHDRRNGQFLLYM